MVDEPPDPVPVPVPEPGDQPPAPAPPPPPSDDPLAPLPGPAFDAPLAPTYAPTYTSPDSSSADDDDGSARPRRRKLILIAIIALVAATGITALIVAGSLNKQTYAIVCEPDQIVVVQGRGFPPWGTRALDDARWKPIKIPAEAPCQPLETADEDELSARYLDILRDRADTLLQARDPKVADDAAALLEQALLHTRAPGRTDQRAIIERLLGDVAYWRATARVREATAALADAAKQLDAAAAKIPRHVRDAAGWAGHLRSVVDTLRAGPGAALPTCEAPAAAERPAAPPGTALPVEPPPSSDTPQPGEPTPPAPPDAGIPSGGVLL